MAGWLAADKVSFFTELKLLEVGEDGLGADTPSLVLIHLPPYCTVNCWIG